MLERRAFKTSEIRAKGADHTIIGHAAVFNLLSDDLGGFKEKIRPGAFARAIKEDDVRALINHDPNFLIGRTKSGTLKLSEDQVGLHIENDLPDTQDARDLMVKIRRGDLTQMSFGFRTLLDDWRFEAGLVVRELIEVELFDVSPVTYPAYPQTDVSGRSMTELRERAVEVRKILQVPALDPAVVLAREAFINSRIPAADPLSLKEILKRAKI